MTPVSCERFRPLVHRPDGLRVRAIKHSPPVPSYIDEPDLQQHTQVLRYRRLLHPQQVHNLSHRPFLERDEVQNLSPAWLGHRIESIRSCRRSCHRFDNTFLYGNMSSTFFAPPAPPSPPPDHA